MLIPGKCLYEGSFSQGKFSGKGRMISKSGDLYIGDFKDDICSGWGYQKSRDGYEYEG
jgi:hypothetical protein